MMKKASCWRIRSRRFKFYINDYQVTCVTGITGRYIPTGVWHADLHVLDLFGVWIWFVILYFNGGFRQRYYNNSDRWVSDCNLYICHELFCSFSFELFSKVVTLIARTAKTFGNCTRLHATTVRLHTLRYMHVCLWDWGTAPSPR